MNTFVVVDASLAVKWVVREADTNTADELALAWERAGVTRVAPYLMPIEVANAIFRRVRQGLISLDSVGSHVSRLFDLGFELQQPSELHLWAIELASHLRQGAVYDCHYLALAELLDCEFWTADERFYNTVSLAYPRVRLLSTFTR